jgi:NADH-quinone oxidoreductase subunit C
VSAGAQEAVAVLRERFGARLLEAVGAPVSGTKERPQVIDPFVRVAPADLLEVMRFCREEPRLRFDMLSCVTAVDYPREERIRVVYDLDSLPHGRTLAVKVDVPRERPRLPSLESVWRTADWHEREAWDLMGVEFEGHPNLSRILCAEDWEGHPLRKDYVIPATYHDIPNTFEQFYDVQNP